MHTQSGRVPNMSNHRNIIRSTQGFLARVNQLQNSKASRENNFYGLPVFLDRTVDANQLFREDRKLFSLFG